MKYKLKRKIFPYVMLLPTLFIFGVFIFYPAITGILNSLYIWDGIGQPVFAGLENYKTIATDKYFWDALLRTLFFTVVSVPLVYWAALGLALLLCAKVRGKGIFRSIFYWPTMISSVVVGLSWKFLLGDMGVINYLLTTFGASPVKFLTNATWAMVIVIFVTVWSLAGYYMVMFLAGLNSIDTTYYEAAEIDGASKWAQFTHITMPLLKPTTLLVIVLSFTTIIKTYPLVYSLTEGGPARATKFVVQMIYETGFRENKMGYACVMTVILFAVLALLTLVQFRVNRGGEQDAN